MDLRVGGGGLKRESVWKWMQDALTRGPLHMTLLDPATCGGKAGEAAATEAARLGSHAIMVGGSTGVTGENLDELVRHVKECSGLPVIYFPSSAGAMSAQVDAIYFLSTLNSRNPRALVREQALGARVVRDIGLETIGMGYIIVEPGMRVGLVSEADPIPRTSGGATLAEGYALAAQYFGMQLVYLEAGSGAPDPVPAEMVRQVKHALDIPLVVGGGIRSREQAETLLDAGADILVTGTIAENGEYERLRGVVDAVRARRTSEGA